jgi:hypothetical protein
VDDATVMYACSTALQIRLPARVHAQNAAGTVI